MDGTELDHVDLAGITLFADLTPSELEAVYQAFDEEHAEPHARLLREGFVGNGFYVILAGEAAWLVGGRQAERAATMIGHLPKPVMLRRGDWFGELSVLFGEPSISDVIARTPMRLLVLPGDDLEEFLLRFPKVMFRLLRGEARRLRDPERWR
jgi:CRP-like cAMP-binding protein